MTDRVVRADELKPGMVYAALYGGKPVVVDSVRPAEPEDGKPMVTVITQSLGYPRGRTDHESTVPADFPVHIAAEERTP